VSNGFKVDTYLGVSLVLFLQLWPSSLMQEAIHQQHKTGYVAGWSYE
jgi:hypothetical protein